MLRQWDPWEKRRPWSPALHALSAVGPTTPTPMQAWNFMASSVGNFPPLLAYHVIVSRLLILRISMSFAGVGWGHGGALCNFPFFFFFVFFIHYINKHSCVGPLEAAPHWQRWTVHVEQLIRDCSFVCCRNFWCDPTTILYLSLKIFKACLARRHEHGEKRKKISSTYQIHIQENFSSLAWLDEGKFWKNPSILCLNSVCLYVTSLPFY